mmetsp:Transcript_84966/g.253289  ORF Transcript_84966/g.253289 Transcript_84966/m.253289 type:complete len:604 (-) Transcript_84966:70-1881(-)
MHPSSFRCPISLECMRDPVVLVDGHSYERQYIESWLQKHGTSPMTGLLLEQKDFYPNHALRTAIQEHLHQAEERPLPGPAAAVLLQHAWAGWDFDAFALAEATDNRPLSTLGMYIFERSGLADEFGLDRRKLSSFLEEIERGYDDANPYHNKLHAASVLQAVNALLEHGGLMQAVAPIVCGTDEKDGRTVFSRAALAKLASLVAAIVHDYDHKGLSNDFLVRTSHVQAIRYNDMHVNEQHSIAEAFRVLTRPGCNFLEHLPPRDWAYFRGLVIDLVLSTDMAEHGRIIKAAHEAPGVSERAGRSAARGPAAREEAPLLRLALRCADLGHLALPWEAHLHWVRRLEQELSLQGDEEARAGLAASLRVDGSEGGSARTQLGFIDDVALPLFRALARAAPGAAPALAAVEANRLRWVEQEAAAATPASKITEPKRQDAPAVSSSTPPLREPPDPAGSCAALPGAMPSGDDCGASAVAPLASLAASSDGGRQVPSGGHLYGRRHMQQQPPRSRSASRASLDERDVPAVTFTSEAAALGQASAARRSAMPATLGQASPVVPDVPAASPSTMPLRGTPPGSGRGGEGGSPAAVPGSARRTSGRACEDRL